MPLNKGIKPLNFKLQKMEATDSFPFSDEEL